MDIYSGAKWLGPSPNESGNMGPVRLGVVHIMEGSLGGTDNWFSNTAAQVSAHFGVGKDGTVHQYVDTSRIAWAEASFNGQAISVELEGYSGDYLTLAQAVALGNLIKWVNAQHGVPFAWTWDPNGVGWIGHGQLGVAGGNHPNCPGGDILSQLPTVLHWASGVATPTPLPQPLPAYGSLPVIGQGSLNWMYVCRIQQIVGAKIDGVYGPQTKWDVAVWQNNHGLAPGDGIVGAKTWEKMGVTQ